MKKISMLPLVAAMVAAAGTAQAQTAPTYSIYGQLDALFTSWTEDNKRVLLEEGARSRIGFRGEDKLNNGWTAFFQLEERFRLDTAAFDTTSRRWQNRAQFGVRGGFGSLSFGYVPSAMDYIYGGSKMAGQDTIGDWNSRRAEANDRTGANGISYASPKFGPMTLYASYGLLESDSASLSDSNFDPHYGIATNISLGAAYIDLGFSQDQDLWKNVHVNGGFKLSDSVELVAGYAKSDRYEQTRVVSDDGGGPDETTEGNDTEDHTRIGVGAKIKVAGGDLSVIFGQADYTLPDGTELETFNEVGATFSYPLSSRMTWLTAVSLEMQDDGLVDDTDGNDVEFLTTEDSRLGVQTGFRLKF